MMLLKLNEDKRYRTSHLFCFAKVLHTLCDYLYQELFSSPNRINNSVTKLSKLILDALSAILNVAISIFPLNSCFSPERLMYTRELE